MPDSIRRWQQETGDTYLLGLVRMCLGGLLFWNALGAARELETEGYFGDHFHLPFLPEALVAPSAVYIAIVAARLLCAVLITVGSFPRSALLVSALAGVYTLLCDRIGYHHNRYALDCYALLLALSPCGRAFALVGPPSTPASRTGLLWAWRLAQVQVSIVYLASGGSKLLDPDWRSGLVIADRLAHYGYQAIERGVPASLVSLLSLPASTSALAKVAIATELFLALGLWVTRTRVFALWWGVLFHLTIEVTSQVETFTWLTLTMYALFATPDVGGRRLFFDPSRQKGVVLARLVVLLDWLARFEVRPWEPDALKKGHVIVVVRRDGSRATGVRALAMVARCVPLLFPLWAPLALVASFTKGGEASARV
jgi:Vitamin K-dependent gamma-carboxylase